MGNKISRDLESLHPFTRDRVLAVLDDCKKVGLNVAVFETIRTLTRQKWLKSNGQSKTLNSYHRLGLAVDIVFLTERGNWTWDRPNSDWDKLADIYEKNGFTAGWRWATFRDGPHGQLDFTGVRSTTLYAKLNELGGEITPEFNAYIWSLALSDEKYSQFLKQKPGPLEDTPRKETEPVKEELKKVLDEPVPVQYNKEEPQSWLVALVKLIASLLGK